ncbi:NAD(P)-binding protein [Hymenopellis radicata]|nr:NAD(P)-binding protein [Hymenopellis radicata]
MSILLTGGTGKTAIRLARLLQAANKPVILTSRQGVVPEPFTGVKLDWYNPATFGNPWAVDCNIESVYLVAPPGPPDVLTPMKPFIDLAVKKGVKRFVLLSVSTLDAGGPAMGKVHEYLISLGVDYFVIRPSWFFENFTTVHLAGIKDKRTIVTASEDGKIGFVSVDDIADLAFDALTRAKSYNTDKILVGPELLSYEDVVKTFSDVLGIKITHTRVGGDDLKKLYVGAGLSEERADMLITLENLNASGVEEKLFADPKKVSGKRTLKSFVEANKDAWKA